MHPNFDPTLGVAMGVEGVYPSMWEVKISHRKLKISISHDVVILASEPDAMLRKLTVWMDKLSEKMCF